MKVLVTGAAGFIGSSVTRRLLERGDEVVAVDNLNDYYDPSLKRARLSALGIDVRQLQSGNALKSETFPGLTFRCADITDSRALLGLAAGRRASDSSSGPVSHVCHLAAQVGVRYSIDNPDAYIQSNLVGFASILQLCRQVGVEHLVYASSSSVYGQNREVPFSTDHRVDHPVSLYAATKRSNELMAHSYSHLYKFPATGLRFFTVYGPWGRPDMASFKFVRAILEGQPIDVFNHGDMQRDFTYVDDIVEGVIRVLDKPQPAPADAPTEAQHRVYNIGNRTPIRLLDFIKAIEDALGIKATKNMMPMQPGDVPVTWADTSGLERDYGYEPNTSLAEGVARFVAWYRDFYDT